MSYETLLYTVDGAIATITLNRPEALNTIVPPMPDEVEAAVNAAGRDERVKVIVLRGAGRAFCAGFDFGAGFHHRDRYLTSGGEWDPGKDFVFATAQAFAPTQKFMSLWRSPKPVIAQVHGWCVGGGSDYALTGKPLSGREAADCGLINEAVPFAELEATVRRRAEQLASVPLSQLAAMKLVVNQAFENMGLGATQTPGPILDGLMRNTPDAKEFIDSAWDHGVRAAVARRDGPFGDYSQAPPDEQPDPANVIRP